MILRNKLSKRLRSISAQNQVIENKALGSSLVHYQFLNVLFFIYVHLNEYVEIIAVRHNIVSDERHKA